MDKLTNTLNLLEESLAESKFYASQVKLILKEKEKKPKEVANVSERKEKKKAP